MIQEIPLNKLERHPDNVRKMKPSGITELAASIERDGLLQNLTVVDGLTKGKHLVIAGARRLAALQLLAKNKKIPQDFAVPCRVVTPADAEAVSLAENQMREQMHPIDQFLAFKAQVDAGQPIPDVAARFGVTEQFVKQRLKLAAVSPKLIDEYRAGKMTLEQLQAFTVTGDHERQLEVWNEVKNSRWDNEPSDIKSTLLNDAVEADDERLKFVGVQAYQKAGGAIIEADLFADKGDESKTLSDPELLERLAIEKLQKRAAKLQKDEGLAWCEPIINFNLYGSDYARVPTTTRDMTKAEAKQYKAIEDKLEAKQKELDAMQESGVEDDEAEEKLCDEIQELEDQRDAIDEACTIPHPDAQQYAGAVVSIDRKGKIEIERNLIRNGDLKQLKKIKPAQQQGKSEDDGDADPAPAAESGHSEKLVRKLTAHKTAILRNQIAKRKDGAGIMAYHLLIDLVQGMNIEDLDLMCAEAPLTLHSRTASLNDADDIESSKALQEFKQREVELLAPIRKALKGAKDNIEQALYDYIMSETTDYQLELLTFLVATQVHLVPGAVKTEVIERDFLSDLIVAEYWQPTRASYFDHVSKAQIVAAVTEKMGEERGAHLAKLTKPEAADRAEEALKDSGWLPGPMRVKTTN